MDSVFQSYIEYLPKGIISRKFGKTNSIFKIKENPNQSLRPIHYGMFRGEIDQFWKERKLIFTEVISEIEKFEFKPHSVLHVPKEGEMFWGTFGGNYCSMHFDLENRHINYFQFGIDITKRESKLFVELILNIATDLEFILLGSNLETFEAKEREIDKYFRNSPAYKMIKTEDKFIADVKLGKEKTDVPFLTLKK